MKEKLKKNEAITLISLVVTIIVLIILAGVSINLILGQDGIITKAREAKQNMELAQIEEQEQLNELYSQMIGESIGSTSDDAIAKLVEFKREIASAITDIGIATSENADATTMANNIRSISGASSADKVSYNNTNSGLTATNVQGAVDEVNNSMIRAKILTFDGNYATNSSNYIYDYSNDEDLKDATIVGVVPIQTGLWSSITYYSFGANTSTKQIGFVLGTGQRVSGTYSVLYIP